MQKCKIGIIGFGTVGKGIYKILNSTNDLHPICLLYTSDAADE